MRFRWLKYRGTQRLFSFLWERGSTNRVYYPSKHHAPQHHAHVRSQYLLPIKTNSLLTQ